MEKPTRFIIIDDDEFNNKICTVSLSKAIEAADIVTFLEPLKGFDYIVSECAKADNDTTAVLFLDINMPVMDGWQFLDRFDVLDANIKNRVKIYILSSSVDKRDIERARKNRNVVQYLVKPLTMDIIKEVTDAQNNVK